MNDTLQHGPIVVLAGGLSHERLRLGGADLLQAAVGLGVDPADEERGHAGDTGEVRGPGVGQCFEPVDVRLDHVGVAIEAETSFVTRPILSPTLFWTSL